jgi:dihydrofolate synthase / folylpolyglutamate synthase
MTDAYRVALDDLFGRLNYERAGMPSRGSGDLRIGRMRRLLSRLGDPQKSLKIVHITGTKGKGSTSAMIAAALKGAGKCVGLATSPHLHRIEERFVVDGQSISELEFVNLLAEVRPAVDAFNRDDAHAVGRPLTFFEITTAMALVLFKYRKVDVAVLEVGMGGRLDSTNAVRPLVSVITSISFDHVRQLGPTLAHIATEKAGIIKRGGRVVSGVTDRKSAAAIRRVAEQRRACMRELYQDFDYNSVESPRPLRAPNTGNAIVTTWRTQWAAFQLPLFGHHQAHNLAVALASLDALAEADPSLSIRSEDVARGLAELKWPARIELLSEKPWLIVDGAHNVASAQALAGALEHNFPIVPRTLVFGTSRDKDLAGQLRVLLPLFDRLVATRYVENPRAVAPEEIVATASRFSSIPALMAPDPVSAIAEARLATQEGEMIVVTGSLFLAAETRASLLGIKPVYSPAQSAAVP